MASFGSGSPSQWAFSGTDPLGSHKLKLDERQVRAARRDQFRENAVWAGNASTLPLGRSRTTLDHQGKQHFLYFRPLLQGQGSFRPILRPLPSGAVISTDKPDLGWALRISSSVRSGTHANSKLTPNRSEASGAMQIPYQRAALALYLRSKQCFSSLGPATGTGSVLQCTLSPSPLSPMGMVRSWWRPSMADCRAILSMALLRVTTAFFGQ